ncbi:hypothetical protein CRG98_018304 [Punica granatum]|uniref:Uncharacterized protein n=1 Tax=Punica granatum TaxID=22663 RepID=A0A2I0JZQ5_PUNGR|nr:hypothetical protein CRG98_018304 [Punica granatum]
MGPERWQLRQFGENGVGTLAPATARCKSRTCQALDKPETVRESSVKKAKNPTKRKRVKRWLCTVDRPSDHDHLFTGEGEGCEEPLERDGTTRQIRERKWHVVEVQCTRLATLGTRRDFLLKRDDGGLR